MARRSEQPNASRAMWEQAVRLLGPGDANDLAVRQAAWVARCVGRGDTAPLIPADLSALAAVLQTRELERGSVLFHAGEPPEGIWILRRGLVELSVGSGRRRSVVGLLRPGDVDGDIAHLLSMPLPYDARALQESTVLYLRAVDLENLLTTRPGIARRWLTSVALRLAATQSRLLDLLGRSLNEQVARLLADEATDGSVPLPQHTIAAMLGVRRPSLNKILKELERDGLIAIRYGAIDILDAEALQVRAD